MTKMQPMKRGRRAMRAEAFRLGLTEGDPAVGAVFGRSVRWGQSSGGSGAHGDYTHLSQGERELSGVWRRRVNDFFMTCAKLCADYRKSRAAGCRRQDDSSTGATMAPGMEQICGRSARMARPRPGRRGNGMTRGIACWWASHDGRYLMTPGMAGGFAPSRTQAMTPARAGDATSVAPTCAVCAGIGGAA